jgi:hypothetical protein
VDRTSFDLKRQRYFCRLDDENKVLGSFSIIHINNIIPIGSLTVDEKREEFSMHRVSAD